MHPDISLLDGLFSAARRQDRKQMLELVRRNEDVSEYATVIKEIKAVSPYTLGPSELRVLQGLMAEAARTASKSWDERSFRLEAPRNPHEALLASQFEAKSSEGFKPALQIETTLRQLARAVGFEPDAGGTIESLKQSLRRLAHTSVEIRKVDRYLVWKKNEPVYKTERKETICSLISVHWSETGSRSRLHVAVSPALAEVALIAVTPDLRGKYFRIVLEEVRQLHNHGLARLLHHRLCGYIDAGKTNSVRLSTLDSNLWRKPAPTPNAAKWRRRQIRAALGRLMSLREPWKVEEPKRHLFQITRPAPPSTNKEPPATTETSRKQTQYRQPPPQAPHRYRRPARDQRRI